MKTKVVEVIIIVLIVFMMGGILTSLKGNDSSDTTEIISEFEGEIEYDTSGYVSDYPFNEDNINIIGKTNGKISDGIATAINKTINWFFEMVKKVVS